MNKDLILLKMSGEPIAQIGNTLDLKVSKSLTGVNEINFTIANQFRGANGKIQHNYTYNLIDGDMIIEYDSEHYVTNTPIETTEDGVAYKEITAYSAEYELRNRLIIDFEGEDRVIYDPSNQKDDNGIYFGLLNYVFAHTDWSVGYVNKDTIRRTQTLQYNKINMLQAITEAQKLFSVILSYDTINKTIDIFDIDQVGEDRGLYLSDENFITQLKKEVNDDDIVTRLYCYGREDVDISRVNITGMPYVEDYSYYMNSSYMSDKLISELKANQNLIAEHSETYNDLFSQLLRKEKEETNQLGGIRLQQGQLDKIQRDFDDVIENEAEREEVRKELEAKEKVIKDMENDLVVIRADMEQIKKQLKIIANEVNIDNNLSEESQKELNRFIKEDVYNNNKYWKYNLDKLYEEGTKLIHKISRPQIKFEISLDDFQHKIDQRIEKRLNLGDIVHIENMVVDEYFQVRLIGIDETEDDVVLRFSSKDSVYDNEIFMEDILAEAAQTSKQVDFSKFQWDKAKVVDNDFRDYIRNNLDLSNQALAKAEGQKPVLDDRGLWLYKEDSNGNPLPEQIRAVNNIIAITKDGWKTIEVAITPEGVQANQLIGDVILGTDLKIVSNSGVVEILENLLTIRDDEGRVRVQLGNYDSGKYGLLIKDKQGKKTVLDEDGMLQVWQEGNVDNVDSGHGLKLHVFIPESTRSVNKALLRFKRDKFRSYSDTTDYRGAVYDTTEWEGSLYGTARTDGAVSTTSGGGGGTYKPTGLATDVSQGWESTNTPGEDHEHRYWLVTNHKHRIDIDEHFHSIDISGHTHTVYIEGHDHRIEIDGHKHEIVPVIKLHDSVPSRVSIYINNSLRFANLTSDHDNLDITQYMEIGKWNEIELRPNGLGRIDATVFMSALMNFD